MNSTGEDYSKVHTREELQGRVDAMSSEREASGQGCNLDIGFEMLLADILSATITAEQKVTLYQ